MLFENLGWGLQPSSLKLLIDIEEVEHSNQEPEQHIENLRIRSSFEDI